jgi:hypothetical protein
LPQPLQCWIIVVHHQAQPLAPRIQVLLILQGHSPPLLCACSHIPYAHSNVYTYAHMSHMGQLSTHIPTKHASSSGTSEVFFPPPTVQHKAGTIYSGI